MTARPFNLLSIRWWLVINHWFWWGLAIVSLIAILRNWPLLNPLTVLVNWLAWVGGFGLAYLVFHSEPWLSRLSNLIFSSVENTMQNSQLTNDLVTAIPTTTSHATNILRHSLMLLILPIIGIFLLIVSRNAIGLGFVWGLTFLYAVTVFPLVAQPQHPVRQEFFTGWAAASETPVLMATVYSIYAFLFTVLLIVV